MSLPLHNPIDFGWFVKGVALDHTGTVHAYCECCGDTRTQEQFKLLVGEKLGFGTPVFVRPFMKRQSTKGKIGGVRGLIMQCTTCDSLWPYDDSGREVLGAGGLVPDGMVSPTHYADYQKRTAEQAEKPQRPQPPSRAKKLD